MKREFSAGGIVFKNGKVLIRRPKANPEYRGNLGWSFPKGWIGEVEKTEAAAVREVAEEGGVQAIIIKKLPTLKIFFTDQNKEKVMKFVTYFVMEWVKDLREGLGWETEEVKWVTLNEALGMLAFKNEKQLLELAVAGTNLRGVLV